MFYIFLSTFSYRLADNKDGFLKFMTPYSRVLQDRHISLKRVSPVLLVFG